MSEEEVKIRGEFTPDPTVCNFTVNREILTDESTVVFRDAASAAGSRLVEPVFGIEGVESVSIKGSTLSVTKNTEDPWPKLATQLIPILKAVFGEEGALINPKQLEEISKMPPAEVVSELITELLDRQINPALNSHGGFAKLHKVEDRDVYIEMGGGCQGCAASRQTMKHGIERAIREAIPQVREVVDMTDHDSGSNPYYR
jgi:Fe-S cluster biogenesis protein NfuA